MYCNVLALALLITYSGSLGVIRGLTIPQSTDNGSLFDSLTALAKDCGNSFLSSQINAHLEECTVVVPPYNEKQFECLIFYDINKQLCDAVTVSKLPLNEDYTNKINEAVEVGTVCTGAKEWNFLNLTEYPKYVGTASKVFNNQITCVKICGVDDVMSQDTNFFCKYYKWGSDMLKNKIVGVPSAVSSVYSTVSNQPTPETQGKPQPDIVPGNESKVSPALVSNVESISNKIPKELETAKSVKNQDDTVKVEEPILKPDNLQPSSTIKQIENNKQISDNSDVEVNKAKNLKPLESAPTNVELSNEGLDKPSAAAIDPELKDEEEEKEDDQPAKIPAINVKDVAAKNKIDDDYQDTEEGKEGLPEGSEDGDDPMLGEVDTKPDTVSKTKNNKIETPMSFAGEREFYPNTIPDGFADDDDHFFPFFLTAVILVVLLYVLYHNKSKVSKVFLGLIVEGRQPGRRRNSRGHAYRRLDTLEQAMSTNSSAPPSKIIY
ncbi:trans-Golgi network integral membrane protein 2-like isoform X1 [Pectinophora gossypiella]|uniref:trans-Golgi network integral membrane protein 2-like isoform X1 n=1 Tax=Pectinophora gossypiella TaxID=13191 RepID=UPI00214E9D92|nr:trans-Golgi network integral membrane protein 2-like isoform X1 [Pectinophora gossypiella]